MSRPRQVSDEDLLSAARDLLAEHGPAVSMRVIADAVGVSSQALLKRFGSRKELILQALINKGEPPFLGLMEGGPTVDRPFKEQLSELMLTVGHYLEQGHRFMSLLRWSDIDPREIMCRFEVPPPKRFIRGFASWLRRANEIGLTRSHDYEASALAIMGSIGERSFLTHVLRVPPTGHSLEEYVRETVELYCRALRPD